MLAVLAAAAALAAPTPSIAILSAKAAGAAIVVKVRIRNFKLYPVLAGRRSGRTGGGHWVIYVDGRRDSLSASPTAGRTRPLKPGFHKVAAGLANDDGSPLSPPANSRTVEVEIRPR